MEIQRKELEDSKKLNRKVEGTKKVVSGLLLALISAGLVFLIFELAKSVFH